MTATILALFILASMAVPGFAVGTCKITINNTNEAVSMNGHTYTAYKIFDVTYDENSGYDYTLAEPFDHYFEGLTSEELPDSYGEDLDAKAYTYVSKRSGNDAALQEFARAIYDARSNAEGHSVTVEDATATSAVIKDLEPGYYLVYDEGNPNTSAPNSERAVANIALTTAYMEATINLKASIPTIDKKITGVSDDASNDASDQGEDGVSAKVGQHVGFQIDSIVPDLTNYTEYTYKVTDTMTEGLTPDNNVKVTIGSDDVTATLNSEHNITVNGQETTVIIPYDTLSHYDKDTPITITYSATVNANAEVYPSQDGNSNEAKLEYSNSINETTTEETPGTKVNIYLFTLEVTKVNADNQALADAEFTLQDSDQNYIPVTLDNTTGRYTVSATLAATAENAKVVSGADGKIYIDGLAAGTYKLYETQAPEGYNALKKPVEIKIAVTYDSNGEIDTISGNSITVVNKSGGILPQTGGMGTYIFLAGGVILMVAAVVVVSKKKKSEA